MRYFESERLHVSVPEGWMAFCGTDSEGKVTQNKIHIYKGVSLETDIFTHAGMTVSFFDREDHYFSPRFFYDNVADIDQFTLGAYTWNGYTCTSFGYPYTMLDTKRDGCVFQVMILMKNGQHEISLEDTDVRRILESLAVKEISQTGV